MRLAEAIRLGSLLEPSPERGDFRHCAIGMAARSTGHGNLCNYSKEDMAGINILVEMFKAEFPWTSDYQKNYTCPVCELSVCGEAVVYHPFDSHVFGDKAMTIEQLADWIDSIDPTPREEPCPENVQPDLVPTFA